MAERLEVYKCSNCSTMAEAIRGGKVAAREFCNIHGMWEVK